jgi:hypothetical protein
MLLNTNGCGQARDAHFLEPTELDHILAFAICRLVNLCDWTTD